MCENLIGLMSIHDFQPDLLSLKGNTIESHLLLVILSPEIFGTCLSSFDDHLMESEMRWQFITEDYFQ